MKELQSKTVFLFNRETEQYEPVTALRGESAYVAAKRLGLTALTEDEWLNEYVVRRDESLAAIDDACDDALASVESKRASVVAVGTTAISNINTASDTKIAEVGDAGDAEIAKIQEKGTVTLDSIPDDYTTLNNRVDQVERDIAAARTQNVHIYGARWDRTNANMTRLYEAESITTDTSGFAHYGSINTGYNNPFDNIYPWNLFRQCNVDLDVYRALESGSDIRDAVSAWYGDPDFKDDGTNGFVGAYRPPYWYTAFEDTDGSVVFAIATGKMDGWRESPAYIRGYGHAVDAGDSLLTCHNDQPLTNVSMSALHTRATNSGFTIDDIYTYGAEVTAAIVEFATMNMQSAIGNGVSDFYRSNEADKPLIAETGATRVVLPAAFASYALNGATLDFSTTKDGVVLANRRTCTGYEEYSENTSYISVTFDEALDVTTDMYVSVHGMANGAALGNASGYIGTNGKSSAFYRGAVLHANKFRYVLGAYRQTGTGAIWVCDDPDACDSYDALNTSVHVNTGCVLPTESGYIDDLHIVEGLGAVPFCKTIGGSSSAPVGDRCYVPELTTANTVLLVGGNASYGLSGGPFFGIWNRAAGGSNWYYAVSPILKAP